MSKLMLGFVIAASVYVSPWVLRSWLCGPCSSDVLDWFLQHLLPLFYGVPWALSNMSLNLFPSVASLISVGTDNKLWAQQNIIWSYFIDFIMFVFGSVSVLWAIQPLVIGPPDSVKHGLLLMVWASNQTSHCWSSPQVLNCHNSTHFEGRATDFLNDNNSYRKM